MFIGLQSISIQSKTSLLGYSDKMKMMFIV